MFSSLPSCRSRGATARLLFAATWLLLAAGVGGAQDFSLNGSWESGVDRKYTRTSQVPGLAQDPAQVSPGTLWYRRAVTLPAGDWTLATLTLHGARFQPQVYVDGRLVSSSEGGMAPTVHELRDEAVAPGRTITLEIALRSLKDTDPRDASAVPSADRWRTNISSGLWDDVSLHFSAGRRITRITPWTDPAGRHLDLRWATAVPGAGASVLAEIVDAAGAVLAAGTAPADTMAGSVRVALPPTVLAWSPERPQLYRLRVSLFEGEQRQDCAETGWGLRHFEAREHDLYLNGDRVQLRGGTVVWHRFLRQPEAAEVAFSSAWFREHITDRLKAYGANTLRFHLGLPPERLLDLCDREGLLVQLEWPFFHGIHAAVPSMSAQWRAWLDVALRHPSVVIVHPWNESENPAELRAGWEALDAILPDYPPFVVAHRDTVHIHKYWWSLFENLGLYYDSPAQFDGPAVVDEFGGNYLDLNGDAGLYPTTKESFLRFLGREQTRAQRLEFHALSNARVGEYWRRLGVAGVLPFCALGSPEDGNTWFLGSLQDPAPMPVWDALAATFSPLSVSLDLWDRNFLPGAQLAPDLHLFNDTAETATLAVEVRVVDAATGDVHGTQRLSRSLAARTRARQPVTLTLPAQPGAWRVEAVLTNPPAGVKHPVVSAWEVRTLAVRVPAALAQARIGVAEDETELRALLRQHGLAVVPLADPAATLLAGSAATWQALGGSPERRELLADALRRGRAVALLDIGPRDLGEGYRAKPLGTLDAAPRLFNPYAVHADLFDGIRVSFRQQSEPESHFHPAPGDQALWADLPLAATWLWNGLRGGLVAPAADMEVTGLSQPALLAQWRERGAEVETLAAGQPLYAYRLADYYAFSSLPADRATEKALRARVQFLAEDAPALRDVLNPDAPITQTDLAAAYRAAATGQAEALRPLATCGKNLARTPVVELLFGPGCGRLVLSQVLTQGRLVRGAAEPGPYGVRHDPAAEQFALNLLAQALGPAPAGPAARP